MSPHRQHLAYTWVPGSEPVLLFIHGLGSNGNCFSQAREAPELKGRALLIPDLVGFGNSPPKASFSYGMEAQAEQLKLLSLDLGICRMAIVAHSMGGAIGIILAETFPGVVTHFVNAVGNLVPEDCFFSRTIVESGLIHFRSEGFEQFKSTLRAMSPKPGRTRSTYLMALQDVSAEVMFESSLDLVRLTDQGKLLERFSALEAKKLYVHDEDNPPPDHLCAALTQACISRVVIPRSGHSLMEDNPQDFYGSVANFLG